MTTVVPSPIPHPLVWTDGGSQPNGQSPLEGAHVLTTMIQRNWAPVLTCPTLPGGELRFHRTNKKVSEGALWDHPQDVIALELSLSLSL